MKRGYSHYQKKKKKDFFFEEAWLILLDFFKRDLMQDKEIDTQLFKDTIPFFKGGYQACL